MAIGSAVQRGTNVFLYDEEGRQVAVLDAGHGPSDGLVGYTSWRVSIRRGDVVITYDEQGVQVSVADAR